MLQRHMTRGNSKQSLEGECASEMASAQRLLLSKVMGCGSAAETSKRAVRAKLRAPHSAVMRRLHCLH